MVLHVCEFVVLINSNGQCLQFLYSIFREEEFNPLKILIMPTDFSKNIESLDSAIWGSNSIFQPSRLQITGV